MTINEIVAEINRILEISEEQYSLWKLKDLIREKIPKFYFMDSNGIYIYASRGDGYRLPLIQFKVKRKKVKIKPTRSWQSTYTQMIATSVTLDTPEVGEMTVEQLVSLHKQQRQEQRNANDNKERTNYLEIKAVLDATGMSVSQLYKLSQVISKRHYDWDKIVEKWGTIPNPEDRSEGDNHESDI